MLTRKAKAQWNKSLKDGNGKMSFGTYKDMPYSFTSRFENGEGTNPEEMIGAAHAGCFSMAFAASLSKAGFNPNSINTEAEVSFESKDAGWRITKIKLNTVVDIEDDIDEDKFQEIATGSKEGCPISNVLSCEIEVDASLA